MGFRKGVTAVERLRTYRGKPFCVAEHLQRWDATVSALGIPRTLSSDVVAETLLELIQRNHDLLSQQRDVGITIFATPGIAGQNEPTLCLHLNPLNHELNQSRHENGQTLVLTDVEQPSAACWPRSIKTRARIHYHLADTQAAKQDASAIGLLVDDDGSITETSIANVAIAESGKIVSPQRDQVLAGVTQSVTEHLAKQASIDWQLDRITPDRLHRADEVLLMGTDTGLWFANRINGGLVGTGHLGPICGKLQTLFQQYTQG